ncbi:MAG TPA: hypothetical protein VF712_04215 [Thermoleophilaceae bacterium]
MAAALSDPPQDWDALAELMAVRPPEAPPKRGPLAVLGRLLFMSAANRIDEAAQVQVRRLGLETTDVPSERSRAGSDVPELIGPTVIEGERHGRSVEVRIDPQRARVKLGGAVAEFHVRSEDGRLVASERSPAAVHEALAGLSPDERWKELEAKGGPEGVAVFQKPRSWGWGSGSTHWMNQLWLAERLAEVAPAA